MKILVADKISERALASLSADGHEVVVQHVAGEALRDLLRTAQPQVLVVRSTRLLAEIMTASANLELIVRAGAGYDTIDVAAASRHGIFVSNCPGRNAAAVAELTMGLLLSLDRSIPDNVADARARRWDKSRYAKARGVKGRVLGLVGMGSIGREVARRGQAFDMEVIAWSRSLTPEAARSLGVAHKAHLLDVAAEADVVSLHVAATPETRHLADRSFFEAMKPGAFFINTTRGSVVDEQALQWAMEEKAVRAAVDVLEGEPAEKVGAFTHPLAAHPGLYVTHHIGASTEQAQEAIAEEAARVVRRYNETGKPPNCVNLAAFSPATHLLTVRHLDRVGVLANVLDEVRRAGWNVQEMDNLVFEGAQAACARIRFSGEPHDAVIDRIGAQENVLAVSLIPL